jgi:hypothetical protein
MVTHAMTLKPTFLVPCSMNILLSHLKLTCIPRPYPRGNQPIKYRHSLRPAALASRTCTRGVPFSGKTCSRSRRLGSSVLLVFVILRSLLYMTMARPAITQRPRWHPMDLPALLRRREKGMYSFALDSSMANDWSLNWRLAHVDHTSMRIAWNATGQVAKGHSPSIARKTFGATKRLTNHLAPLSVPMMGVTKQVIERTIFRSIFADAIGKHWVLMSSRGSWKEWQVSPIYGFIWAMVWCYARWSCWSCCRRVCGEMKTYQ